MNEIIKNKVCDEEELHKDFWEWYSENFPNEYKKIIRKRK